MLGLLEGVQLVARHAGRDGVDHREVARDLTTVLGHQRTQGYAWRTLHDHGLCTKWGLPVLAIDCAIGENEELQREAMRNDMAEMLEAAGAKDVRTWDDGYAPGMGIHEMGTARMGRDPRTSVLNAHNQVWDALNVFVTDGSCMTSAPCQNPSLTYMALTARAADWAVQELNRQNL